MPRFDFDADTDDAVDLPLGVDLLFRVTESREFKAKNDTTMLSLKLEVLTDGPSLGKTMTHIMAWDQQKVGLVKWNLKCFGIPCKGEVELFKEALLGKMIMAPLIKRGQYINLDLNNAKNDAEGTLVQEAAEPDAPF